jgi:hypothetical protein
VSGTTRYVPTRRLRRRVSVALLQQRVAHRKRLLHHHVLAQVVLALDQLSIQAAVGADAVDDLGHIDAAGRAKRLRKADDVHKHAVALLVLGQIALQRRHGDERQLGHADQQASHLDLRLVLGALGNRDRRKVDVRVGQQRHVAQNRARKRSTLRKSANTESAASTLSLSTT